MQARRPANGFPSVVEEGSSIWPSSNPSVIVALIFVTDDELSVREALGDLLESVGLQVALFGSAAAMLKQAAADAGRTA